MDGMKIISREGSRFIVQTEDKREYDVNLDPLTCSCGSFRYKSPRVVDNNYLCKHIKHVVENGFKV